MKQLIAILILLSLLPINLFSKTNLNVTPDNGNTEIDLSAVNPIKDSGGIRRSRAIKLVTAYISGNMLTINFNSSTTNANIIIRNSLNNDVEYMQICNSPFTVIDLSRFAQKGNTYIISISTASWSRYGKFEYSYN